MMFPAPRRCLERAHLSSWMGSECYQPERKKLGSPFSISKWTMPFTAFFRVESLDTLPQLCSQQTVLEECFGQC